MSEKQGRDAAISASGDLPVTFEDVARAGEMLTRVMDPTPMIRSRPLSGWLEADVRLKLENLTMTGSFKERGAFIRLSRLSDAEVRAGVIACSAGNHAQGVAFHARELGISAVIVMPEGTPFSKVTRTEALGADVRLVGEDFNAALQATHDIMEREGRVFIPPFDDPDIIAGQGSCGLEIAQQAPDLNMLLVPIGGGGLISGVAVALKRLCPHIRIIGVQAESFPSMLPVMTGRPGFVPRPVTGGQTIAEGIAVKSPGEITRKIVEALVDDVMIAGESWLEKAVVELLERQKLVIEGAGAAGLAVMLERPELFRGRKVGMILSGGNIDSRLLATSLLRAMGREDRIASLRVALTDRPGELARLTGAVGRSGGNIIEIYHDRMFYDLSVKIAEVDMVIETRGKEHLNRILAFLRQDGFSPRLSGKATHPEITDRNRGE